MPSNTQHLEIFLLGFARCVGCVARAPGLSHQSVPPPLRAGLAFLFALGIGPHVHTVPGLASTAFIFTLVGEVLLGAAIGFAATILYESATAGGKLLDSFVGVQLQAGGANSAGDGFGGLWGNVFLAAFFLLDGYQLVIDALVKSFDAVPIGGTIDIAHWRAFALAIPPLMTQAAVLVAAPSIILSLISQIGIGAVSRVVPRFNNQTLNFPVSFGAILLATIVVIPFAMREGGQPWLVLPFQQR